MTDLYGPDPPDDDEVDSTDHWDDRVDGEVVAEGESASPASIRDDSGKLS